MVRRPIVGWVLHRLQYGVQRSGIEFRLVECTCRSGEWTVPRIIIQASNMYPHVKCHFKTFFLLCCGALPLAAARSGPPVAGFPSAGSNQLYPFT